MKNVTEIKKKLVERDGPRCAITGEIVTSPDELSIDYLVPRSMGGTDDLDNLILVKHHVNASVSEDERRRTRLLLKELKERQEELSAREAETFKREQAYRKELDAQQAELERFRHQLRKEQAEREAMYQAELDSQRKAFKEQQERVHEQLKVSERAFAGRLQMLEAERTRLSQEISERENRLHLSYEELEREKQKYTEESRRKIESSSTAYVNEALGALEAATKNYHDIARNWSLLGLVSLLLGVVAATYFGLVGVTPAAGASNVDWPQVVFFGLKGIVVVVLFIAIAKYCYGYSQSFMHESIKNSERKHAINFGRFYLQSYGANADWAQVKEAFEHWNIAPSSAFSKNDADAFDPKPIERAAQLLESISKLRFPKGDGSDAPKKAP